MSAKRKSLADLYAQFANAENDALRSAIRARLNRKDRAQDIDEDAVFRGLSGRGSPGDEEALRSFTLMLLENETERFKQKATGEGPGRKRNPHKLDLQQRIKAAVDAKCAENGLPRDRNFGFIADDMAAEIQKLEDAGENPREWPDYFKPTKTAIRDLYYGY